MSFIILFSYVHKKYFSHPTCFFKCFIFNSLIVIWLYFILHFFVFVWYSLSLFDFWVPLFKNQICRVKSVLGLYKIQIWKHISQYFFKFSFCYLLHLLSFSDSNNSYLWCIPNITLTFLTESLSSFFAFSSLRDICVLNCVQVFFCGYAVLSLIQLWFNFKYLIIFFILNILLDSSYKYSLKFPIPSSTITIFFYSLFNIYS
jgi:hypothetical protein